MPVVDSTRSWWNTLDNYVAFGARLAPDTPATRRFTEENAPELPTRQEWNPDGTGNNGMLGNFRRLFNTLQLFSDGEPDNLFTHSLFFSTPPATDRYVLVSGNREAHGRLYMLDAVPAAAPFTNNLRRFVVYIPAHYTRNGDSGHYAWLHFTPVWGGRRARAPRAAAVTRNYPDSIWVHKYIADYLFGHRLLASFSAASVNAVFFLPVHRFSVADALAPLSNVRALMEILRQLFVALESLEPRLRARSAARSGSVAGAGVSCFSFGGFYCSRVFRRPTGALTDYDKLRAGAFLDGVSEEANSACQWMVSRTSGWLRRLIPGSSDIPKRLILFQQPNRGVADFVGPFPRAIRASPLAQGGTLDEPGAPPSLRNLARFHRVHLQDMMCTAREPNCRNPRHGYFDWHGRIHAFFAETAFEFCRDCFQR